MSTRKFAAALVAASALFAAPAFAQEGVQDDFLRLFQMASIDKNKDGMVSKREFIAMMEKAYDMKTRQMGPRTRVLTEGQMRDLFKQLYVGG